MFFKIGALKNFVIFKEKQLCWTLYLNRKMKLLKSKIKFEKKQKKKQKKRKQNKRMSNKFKDRDNFYYLP